MLGEELRAFSYEGDEQFVEILKKLKFTSIPEKYITFNFSDYHLHVAHSPAVRYFPVCFVSSSPFIEYS